MEDKSFDPLHEFENGLVYSDDFNKAIDAITLVHRYQKVAARCLFIVAYSGIGKSSILKRYTSSFEQPETDESKQIKVIYIPQVANLSNESLAAAILTELGDPKPFQGRFSEQMARIKNYKNRLGLELIIIDEIQELMPTTSVHDRSKVVSFLKLLMNTIGVGVVVAGLPKAEHILQVDEQLRTRAIQSIHLHSFTMKSKEENERFAQFVKEIMKKYPAKIPGLFSSTGEGLYRMLLATHGNKRIFKNLLSCAFYASPSKELVTMDHLHLAWQAEASKFKNEMCPPFKATLNAVKKELAALELI